MSRVLDRYGIKLVRLSLRSVGENQSGGYHLISPYIISILRILISSSGFSL
jgi:hypothetical protein